MAARPQIITLSDAAVARVKELVAGADRPVYGLRVGVEKGGCAGMSYTMELADAARPGDEVVEADGARVLIDARALLYLLGTRMDFERTRLRAGFVFQNPNETSACGCGESVAITPVMRDAAAAE